MSVAFRIALSDVNSNHRSLLTKIFQRAGHRVVVSTESTDELLLACAAIQLDLAVIEIDPLDSGRIEIAGQLWASHSIPTIAVCESVDNDIIEQAVVSHIAACLLKPVREPELLAAIRIATQYSAEIRELQTETENIRQALEDRKLIDRAKGILMHERNLDEDSAFKCLLSLARNNRQKLVEVAKGVLLVRDVIAKPTETVASHNRHSKN